MIETACNFLELMGRKTLNQLRSGKIASLICADKPKFAELVASHSVDQSLQGQKEREVLSTRHFFDLDVKSAAFRHRKVLIIVLFLGITMAKTELTHFVTSPHKKLS